MHGQNHIKFIDAVVSKILRRGWEDNIKMNLKELGWGMDWIDQARNGDRKGGFCECGNGSSGSIKCGEFLD